MSNLIYQNPARELHVFENSIDLLKGMWPTPLVKLGIGKNVWAKLEFYNPFSRSIKDRTAYYLFQEAVKKGSREIIESSSGNFAIAMSILSILNGIKPTIFLPEHTPEETKILLELLGVNVIVHGKTTIESLPIIREYVRKTNAYHPNQFYNETNVRAHMETTAKEIDMQLNAVGLRPEIIISGIGTGGHITGISRYMKTKYKDVKIIGVLPAENEVIPGLRRQKIGDYIVKPSDIDEIVEVTLHEALQGIVDVAKSSGLLVGISSGATVAALKKLNENEKITIIIFPDDLFKYMSILKSQILKGVKH